MNMIIATHNAHKIEEFGRILAPLSITVQTAELTEAEETGTTFRENAYIKAKSACDETGLPCVADDSGLSIDYLNGEPGVYSARYAEPGKRKATVLEKLKGVPEEKRGAHFTSAICCVFPNGDVLEAEGYCYGRIAEECRGEPHFHLHRRRLRRQDVRRSDGRRKGCREPPRKILAYFRRKT
jgi:XTP/dITP diphosphohydrolase